MRFLSNRERRLFNDAKHDIEEKLRKLLVIKREDELLYAIALNLTGNANDFIEKACNLVEKEGSLLKALKVSRKLTKEVTNERL